MSKLTDSQLIVLSAAAARDDGSAVAPQEMRRAAASKVGSSLVARKLMREVRAKTGMPVWRADERGRRLSLIMTKAGRDAIGVEEDRDELSEVPAQGKKASRKSPAAVAKSAKARPVAAPSTNSSSPRKNSKQALVVRMLSAKSGATLDALIEATGWLPHTTRAALTGLRKRGFSIERSRTDGEASIYRIIGPSAKATA